MVLTDKLNRAGTLLIASLLFLASLVPLLTREKASAYQLLGDRSIQMSSSANGNTAAGQDVTYAVSFEVTDGSQDIGGVVVEFCSNSPIIGDTCTAPTGMDIDAANLAVGLTAGLTGFAKDTGNSTANKLVLNEDAGVNGVYESTNNEVLSFNLGTPGTPNDGVDNPENVNTSFYARILTFTTAAGADEYTATDINDADASGTGPHVVIDAGGIALSTAEQITVTAKVQERLTFCVYTFPTEESAPGANDWADAPADPSTDNSCSAKAGSSIILGDVNGVLDSERGYVDGTSYFTISTNAAQDAIVRIKGDTLSNGTATINAIGSTPTASDDNTEQFGMCAYHYDTSGSATLFIANGSVNPAPTGDTSDYTGDDGATADCSDIVQSAHLDPTNEPAEDADHNGALFSFDPTLTNTTYGDVIAVKEAGPPTTARMAFLGNITDTTEPGVYTTTLTFIATGTY